MQRRVPQHQKRRHSNKSDLVSKRETVGPAGRWTRRRAWTPTSSRPCLKVAAWFLLDSVCNVAQRIRMEMNVARTVLKRRNLMVDERTSFVVPFHSGPAYFVHARAIPAGARIDNTSGGLRRHSISAVARISLRSRARLQAAWQPILLTYSYRRATIGSTLAALLAGIQHAKAPVATNNKVIAAKVAGS
jgi:hypothetical protein